MSNNEPAGQIASRELEIVRIKGALQRAEELSDDVAAAYEEREVRNANFSHLQEHFETLVFYGYEDGWGGFGDVLLNVQTRKITVERNDRFEDCTTSSYEGLHGPPN